jgi:hypothetical protein
MVSLVTFRNLPYGALTFSWSWPSLGKNLATPRLLVLISIISTVRVSPGSAPSIKIGPVAGLTSESSIGLVRSSSVMTAPL